MLLGEKIAKQRKELKLSQAELAKGICTQATISKIEKRNIAPLTETLSAICVRLGLTLNDVMTEFTNNQAARTKESMNAVKQLLAHYQFEDAKTKFSQIEPDTVPATLKSQYHSLQANIFLVCDDDFDNAIFIYGVAVQEAAKGIDELIVDSGIGTAYAAHGDNEKAEYYFSKINYLATEFTVTTENAFDFIKALNNTGTFYSKTGDYAKSNQITKKLIDAFQLLNPAPYLDQAFYRLAYNHYQMDSKGNQSLVEQELSTSKTVAQLFGNQELLKYINDFHSHHRFTLNN